ncbi:MAG TPA: hypothetical protein PKW80_12830 [Bacteroidales bacterium]|nr:hypothetical protein [Bacteroidales bacterium]
MKKHLLFTLYTLLSAIVLAQAPQKISYQAVVRDSSGNILASQSVSLMMIIRDGSSAGPDVYHETHDALTNQYGLVSLKIGGGNNPSTSFSSINWTSGEKYLEIQLDADGPSGGYTWSIFGVTQLVSVPYALNAEKANVIGMAGLSGQTLRNDGTAWTANSFLYNNGSSIGIGTTTPAALLHTSGAGTGEGNVVFTGQYKASSPGAAPVEGAGTRMMWYPDKAAFRAGTVDNNVWNTSSVGGYSVAFGYNTRASGTYSAALGYSTNASGMYSSAIGYGAAAAGDISFAYGYATIASGMRSFAGGYFSQASGQASVALGYQPTASGDHSISLGNGTTASGLSSIALGYYSKATSAYSAAIGKYVNAASYNEIALVSYL